MLEFGSQLVVTTVNSRNQRSGGEGGIRTLDTGVSPYNGLANSTRPLPIARNQSVTVTSGVLSRAESDVYKRQEPMRS